MAVPIRCLALLIIVTFFSFCGPRSGISEVTQTRSNLLADTATEKFRELSRAYAGAKLFKKNCANCHRGGKNCRLKGKPFEGIEEIIPPPQKEYFINFTLNSDSVIKTGDLYANKIYEENSQLAMPSFTGVLTRAEVSYIYDFVTNKEIAKLLEKK